MTPGDKQTPPKRRRWRRYLFAGLALLFLLLLAGTLLPWLAPSLIPGLVPPAQEDTDKADAMRALEHRLVAVERRLKIIADDVAANTAKGPEVVPVASSKLWWIAETERYLTEAGERLDNGGNVKAALSALKSARQTLAGVDIAAAGAVKKALNEEILLLSKYRNRNAAQALAAIDALLKRFEIHTAAQDSEASVKAAASAADTGTNAAAATSDPDLWTRLTDAVGDRVNRLVVTQKKSEVESAPMTHGLVTRSLLLARTAVLGNDKLSYRYAIVNAIQALERNDEVNSEMYGELQTLRTLDITDTPPRIGKALSTLQILAGEMNLKGTNRETGP